MKKKTFTSITKILPHRKPILAIDSYERIDSNSGISQKYFSISDYGCRGEFVTDSILIECMAQATAAHMGYQNLSEKKPAGLGMLVSVDIFTFQQPVKSDTTVRLHVRKTNQIGAFNIIEGKIYQGDTVVAEGTLKVFEPKEDNH